jgi:hypothetical protein
MNASIAACAASAWVDPDGAGDPLGATADMAGVAEAAGTGVDRFVGVQAANRLTPNPRATTAVRMDRLVTPS